MSSSTEPEASFKIAHVLMLDVVGYSKLLITEQSAVVGALTKVVKNAPRFRRAEAEGKLLRLPTGDGLLLVFFDDPQAPLECAMEVTRAMKEHPDFRLRMGIHSGPVNDVVDVNDRSNVAGAGVDMAQRVMDCGDAGHILLSQHVADDLAPFPRWNPHLHELGECEVKHGRKLSLVNFYTDEIGNPAVPTKFSTAHASKTAEVSPKKNAGLWIGIAAAALILAAIAFAIFWQRPPSSASAKSRPSPSSINAKSIAVLPFENLSADSDNAYFADGIQEEILTRLSKISQLKVISRTSTQRYRGSAPNLSEIARQLGVANILEGSVQKAGDQVRVNAQLINALDDSHLWAEKFDRKLTDIFAVESEIASKIADKLQAKLTGAEQTAIATRPTENSEAHQLYLRGRFYWNKWGGADFEKSRDFYEQAIALDPNYALAYAGLADYYGFAFANGVLPPEEKWARLEEENAKKALALDPTLGEAFNPLAAVKLYFYRDWPAAKRDFQRGLELSPNFAEMHQHYALCLVLFGENEEAIAEMKRALDLDPLSPRFNFNSGRLQFFLRNYDAAIVEYRKAIELEPAFPAAHEWLGYALEKKGMEREALAEWSKASAADDQQIESANPSNTFADSGFSAVVRELASRKLDRLKEKAASGSYVSANDFALAALRAGETETAMDWLGKAVQERSRSALEIKINPLFDTLRGDPRFTKLMRENLPNE